ncbi:hypothetical protein DFH06DRAFT_1292001 [Mycena polygramma]|nr:hypothetical protein DFH06DRAFT_1292001 [Mycena polygramma]
MSWADHLNKAKTHLKASRLKDSLTEVNEALRVGGDREYTVYDTRAAIYEKQGKPKNALQDVKNVIQLAPTHWQGYARASRLFLSVRKLDEAITMADMALSRLEPGDVMRRKKLNELKEEVLEHRRRQTCHFVKLPVELITAIFETVVASDSSRVLTIWAVSKHWHNIAVNTPSLWSTLILTSRHPARHSRRWIERSKGRIREISFHPTSSVETISLRGMLWSHLRICKLENPNIANYIGGKTHQLASLEELHIKGSIDCDLLLSIPDSKLQRLKLEGTLFSWDVLASYHRNLTSLEVLAVCIPPSLETLMVILGSNPMLEQLTVNLDGYVHEPLSSPPPLTLPNLHTLQLGLAPWTPRFFALVTMPRLETLRLANLRAVGLSSLIEQRPPLISLSLNSSPIPSTELLTLLDLTPTLRKLELTRLGEVANPVVEALGGRGDGGSTLCPALEHLDISNCSDAKTAPIVALLNSRNPPVEGSADATPPPVLARIRTLKADGCPLIQANVIPWIRTRVKTFSCVYMTKRQASWRR